MRRMSARRHAWAPRNGWLTIIPQSGGEQWKIFYRAAKRRGDYFSLGTDTEGNNCFSICQNIEMKQEINFYVTRIAQKWDEWARAVTLERPEVDSTG